jgi:hypothetical protein
LVVWGFPVTDDAALVALRVTVGARRGVMRRRDERVIVAVREAAGKCHVAILLYQ